MPLHLVEPHIESGKLVALALAENPQLELPIHVVHDRARPPRRAGRMLIEDLKVRLTACPKHTLAKRA